MKRSLWTYDETLEMLNVMMEQESLKAMNGRPFRKDKAFRLVQDEMAQRGYLTKDAKQIENRWKNLKKRYVDIHKDPSSVENASFQYYDEIDLLLKGKSCSTGPDGSYVKNERKLFEESINRRIRNQNIIHSESSEVNDLKAAATNQLIAKIDPSNETVDDSVCADVAMKEEVVEATEETPKATQRRSKRITRGKNRRYNIDIPKQVPYTPRVTEDEVFRSQKRLVDYQFELYSRAQRESDAVFLQMSRQMLEQSDTRFQTFVAELLTTESKTTT